MQNYKLTIDETFENERLDVVLAGLLENLSRSKIQTLIKNKQIKVNGKEGKASYKVLTDDVIEINNIEESVCSKPIPQNIPLDIRYEDDDMLVVNKPSGMLTHPTTIEKENTLVNALLYYTNSNLSILNGEFRAGIVHRLDRNTSGLLMIAKNDFAYENLKKQIQEKTAIRKYIAVLTGVLNDDEGIIETNFGRHPTKPQKMAVLDEGKLAITKYKVLKRFPKNTFVEFELKTGRTHQIRVHSAYIHHPIVNDTLYGGEKLKLKTDEQVLQAYDLTFSRPSDNKIINIKIDYDDDIKRTLTFLENRK